MTAPKTYASAYRIARDLAASGDRKGAVKLMSAPATKLGSNAASSAYPSGRKQDGVGTAPAQLGSNQLSKTQPTVVTEGKTSPALAGVKCILPIECTANVSPGVTSRERPAP